MPRFASPYDSASLFYRDYIPDAQFTPTEATFDHKDVTLVFLHGWPMSSLMFDQLLIPLCQNHSFRCIAPDRRGFGQSDWSGHLKSNATKERITYDTFTDDVTFLLEDLAVGDFVFIGASMGTGESLLAWERSAYVQKHCKGFIWIACNLPFPIQSPSNPSAPSLDVWHSVRTSMRAPRSDFVSASLPGVFGVPAGAVVSAKTLEHYERIVAQADGLAVERTAQILLQRDFTPDVKQLGEKGEQGVKLMLLHGDSDTGMPYEASSKIVKELVPAAEVRIYENAGHGLYLTHAEQVLSDILEFVGGVKGN